MSLNASLQAYIEQLQIEHAEQLKAQEERFIKLMDMKLDLQLRQFQIQIEALKESHRAELTNLRGSRLPLPKQSHSLSLSVSAEKNSRQTGLKVTKLSGNKVPEAVNSAKCENSQPIITRQTPESPDFKLSVKKSSEVKHTTVLAQVSENHQQTVPKITSKLSEAADKQPQIKPKLKIVPKKTKLLTQDEPIWK